MSRKNRNPNAYEFSEDDFMEDERGYTKMGGGAKDRKPRAEDPVKQARRSADAARWEADQAAAAVALGGPRRR